MWKQLELFNFDSDDSFIKPPAGPKKKKKVDYEKLYELFKKQKYVSFSEIERLSGVEHCGVAQVITTLSLRFPIYETEIFGVYKLYGADDYGDGINHAALERLYKEMEV